MFLLKIKFRFSQMLLFKQIQLEVHQLTPTTIRWQKIIKNDKGINKDQQNKSWKNECPKSSNIVQGLSLVKKWITNCNFKSIKFLIQIAILLKTLKNHSCFPNNFIQTIYYLRQLHAEPLKKIVDKSLRFLNSK
jgi:hypothetical protein